MNTQASFSSGALLQRIREQKPLIHHITNMVVMNDTANITLAIGALPVMAHAIEEVEEMVNLAGALVLNIGTLYPAQVDAMLLAGKRANARNIPIVLDPVGAGATRFRTETAHRLLTELRIAVVRGNASEIAALVGIESETRGVESISVAATPEQVVQRAAHELNTTVAITGVQDLISDGSRLFRVDNGHPLLASITGSGCMATSLVGAFLAVESDALQATTAALVAMGLAGEKAARLAGGPGTFRSHLLDAVASLEPQGLTAGQKVSFA
jgi:hydroxyethylthiazole kinase